MTKRLPSRNHRSKGIKVKYVLQIILLLGVCFWLIYQIKHSHDKKKEFDENDAKTLVKTQNTDEILKVGRKDLRRGMDDKHEEEEEDETIGEDEGDKHEHGEQEEEEEGNKHESEEREEENNSEVREQGEENKDGAEDQDEDENKSEGMERRERGGGDDDIDENDQEIPEADADHDEEFIHDERDKEEEVDEKETENSKDEEKEGIAEKEHTHEAREEHYKADDASSAVAHDDKTANTETETLSLENADSNLETSVTKPGYTQESNGKQNDSDFKVTEGEMTGNISLSASATNGKEHVNNSLSDALNGSNVNTSVTTNSDSHLEANSAVSVVIIDSNNNSTGTNVDTLVSSEQNKMVILSVPDEAQNATADTTVTGDITNVSQENPPDSNATVSVGTKNGDAAGGESSNPGAVESEKTIRSVATQGTETNSRNSDAKENVDTSKDEKSNDKSETADTNKTQNNGGSEKEDTGANEDEKFKVNTETVETYKTQNNVGNLDAKENTDSAKVEKSEGDTQAGETEETSDSSANETSDEVERDAIDAADSHTHTDMTQVQTDLETLPDTRNQGNNGDETAAE